MISLLQHTREIAERNHEPDAQMNLLVSDRDATETSQFTYMRLRGLEQAGFPLACAACATISKDIDMNRMACKCGSCCQSICCELTPIAFKRFMIASERNGNRLIQNMENLKMRWAWALKEKRQSADCLRLPFPQLNGCSI